VADLSNTAGGMISMVPQAARAGDRIAIIFGCGTPVVLRPRDNSYQLIGSCFVEGIMKVEAVAYIEEGLIPTEMIPLC
jgi:hypothetical protein